MIKEALTVELERKLPCPVSYSFFFLCPMMVLANLQHLVRGSGQVESSRAVNRFGDSFSSFKGKFHLWKSAWAIQMPSYLALNPLMLFWGV